MRPRVLRARMIAAFVVIGWFIAAAVAFSAPARADGVADWYADRNGTAICATLDKHPTDYGVRGIYEAITEDGLTGKQAAAAIVTAVNDECPWHQRTLDHFAGIGSVLA